MSLIRKGTAEWFGTGLEGNGELSSPSGVLNKTPYNLSNRFENENGVAGTNPEELIAAAHAGKGIDGISRNRWPIIAQASGTAQAAQPMRSWRG